MRIAKKLGAATVADDLSWELDDAEGTGARRVRLAPRSKAAYFGAPLTRRMAKVDPRLIAISRGEIEPDKTLSEPPRPTRKFPMLAKAAAVLVMDTPDGSDPSVDPFGGLIPVDMDEPPELEEGWLDRELTDEEIPPAIRKLRRI